MCDVLAEALEGIAGRLSIADSPEGIENAVNELLALATGQRALPVPEYEYRAVASTRHPMPTGWFREAGRAEGWLSLDPRYNAVERRVKAGQPERVQ